MSFCIFQFLSSLCCFHWQLVTVMRRETNRFLFIIMKTWSYLGLTISNQLLLHYVITFFSGYAPEMFSTRLLHINFLWAMSMKICLTTMQRWAQCHKMFGTIPTLSMMVNICLSAHEHPCKCLCSYLWIRGCPSLECVS